MLLKGIYYKYGDELAEKRKEGWTLQMLADKTGVSRERIRQILNKYYSGVTSTKLNERQVSKKLGVSEIRLAYLRKKGLVRPKWYGGLIRYTEEDIHLATLALMKQCLHCGVLLPSRLIKYCRSCATEYRRYSYPFLSSEAKQLHRQSCIKWMKNNPEKAKVIQVRAEKAFRVREKKKYFANTVYIVRRGKKLPLGMRFKALACEHQQFILSDGRTIPVSHCMKEETYDELLGVMEP